MVILGYVLIQNKCCAYTRWLSPRVILIKFSINSGYLGIEWDMNIPLLLTASKEINPLECALTEDVVPFGSWSFQAKYLQSLLLI